MTNCSYPYSYAYNSPMTWRDPSGLAPEKEKMRDKIQFADVDMNSESHDYINMVHDNLDEFMEAEKDRLRIFCKSFESFASLLFPDACRYFFSTSVRIAARGSATVYDEEGNILKHNPDSDTPGKYVTDLTKDEIDGKTLKEIINDDKTLKLPPFQHLLDLLRGVRDIVRWGDDYHKKGSNSRGYTPELGYIMIYNKEGELLKFEIDQENGTTEYFDSEKLFEKYLDLVEVADYFILGHTHDADAECPPNSSGDSFLTLNSDKCMQYNKNRLRPHQWGCIINHDNVFGGGFFFYRYSGKEYIEIRLKWGAILKIYGY